MKKLFPIALIVILLGIGLVYILNSDDASKDNKPQTSQSSTSKTSEVEDLRQIDPVEEVSVLRRELYEAGINSREMSDSDIEEYAKKAKEKDLEFVTYVKEEVVN